MESNFKQIKTFIQEVENYLIEYNDTKFIQETYVEYEGKIRTIDSSIVRNNEVLAIFEYKTETKKIKPQYFSEAVPTLNFSFRFLVISTGRYHKVLDRYSGEVNTYESTKELLDAILKRLAPNEISKIKSQISETIEKVIFDYLEDFKINNHPLNKLKPKIKNHFSKEKIKKNLLYNNDGQFFHLSKDIRNLSNFENQFFKLLIEELKPNEYIYRYTTLDTVFSTIKYASVRLNGIVGMNDISEVGYVQSYFDNGFIPMESDEDINEVNNRFILCSSTLNDDLMQWRLYGDDCKGACLKFKVNQRNALSGLQLRKINYGIERDGKNYHPELELISLIIKSVKDLNKQSIQFRALGIWKHFFKSYEYKPEKEVRLLLIRSKNNSIKGEQQILNQPHNLKKDWDLTTSHRIANPYVTISLSDILLPIELTEVVFGAKCPEVLTNMKQFQQLLKEKNLTAVTTSLSKIINYR
ncbi:DUF2971 domain-containing protein [Draconibacterium orientale]|uniref:DUF2971 domain-containing protein n=1 Tax=Draconibacterium orientale TaxID=1168034 RepID=UPI002A0A48FD|nr:DUF2971 domain-containing protein [Draconibacterium orientale]